MHFQQQSRLIATELPVQAYSAYLFVYSMFVNDVIPVIFTRTSKNTDTVDFDRVRVSMPAAIILEIVGNS